jgi:diguanylate cyclase (GGDEF)-like protein
VRVLVGDPESVSRAALEHALTGWGHDVVTVDDGAKAWHTLVSGEAPELAILDGQMPVMSGLEICRHLRKTGRDPYVFTIIFTSKDGKQERIAALNAGADDCLTKPLDPAVLEPRIRSAERILDLLRQLRSSRERTEVNEVQDIGAGLVSSGEIRRILDREVTRSRRDERAVSVLLVGLESDEPEADEPTTCREVARRMREAQRRYDPIGRFRQHELLVVLPGCRGRDAVSVAERHRTVIQKEPVVLPGGPVSLSVSIGVAAAEGRPVSDASSMLEAADRAYRAAREKGRNRVEFAA